MLWPIQEMWNLQMNGCWVSVCLYIAVDLCGRSAFLASYVCDIGLDGSLSKGFSSKLGVSLHWP